MTIHSLLRSLFASRTRRTIRKAPARCRPLLESLEDRALPSVTFAPAVNYFAALGPLSVAAGAFNRDAKQDLAVANRDSNSVSVFLGKGDGAFQNAVSYGAGISTFSVAVGDFNGDGKQDLAAANYTSNNV